MKRVVRSNMKGVRLRGRPRTGWMNNVKRASNEKEMSVEQGRMIVHDRSESIAVVNVGHGLDHPWRKLLCIWCESWIISGAEREK